MRFFFANDGKFIMCKERKNICKNSLRFRVKNTVTHKYPENFPNKFILGTTAYRCLKPTSASSNWSKQ